MATVSRRISRRSFIQSAFPLKCFLGNAERSMPSRVRALIAAISLPFGSVAKANGWMQQMEQLHSSSASISPSASNAMSPQWQLPEYLVGILDLLLGMRRPRQPGGRPCGDKRAHGGEGERGVVARALGQAREDGKP